MQNKKTHLKTPSCNKHFILPDYFVIIIIRNHFKTVLMKYLLQIIKALSLIMKTWSGNGHLAQQSRHRLVHYHPSSRASDPISTAVHSGRLQVMVQTLVFLPPTWQDIKCHALAFLPAWALICGHLANKSEGRRSVCICVAFK